MGNTEAISRDDRTEGASPKSGDAVGVQNVEFLERLYADYRSDPQSVPADYRRYFESLRTNGPIRLAPSFRPPGLFEAAAGGERASAEPAAGPLPGEDLAGQLLSQHRVDKLIRNFRVRGHIIARTNPLGLPRTDTPPLGLDPEAMGLTTEDMDRTFAVELAGQVEYRTLRDILMRMLNTYCHNVGVQFMHMDNWADRRWLLERMEPTENRATLSRDEQVRIVTRLTDAVMLEEFIQTRYVGAKSFSLEGAETLIPLLDMAIESAGARGIDEIVLGMAHRGRLNVLANILDKRLCEIFREFEDRDASMFLHGGDVKYHQGHSGEWTTATGWKIHLSLCFNPSHLEFINPVAIGRVRAKQDREGDRERRRKMAILIHGDASFAGEGIVAETLNLSQLAGYSTGGTLHIIIDNLLGFTTGPEQNRSTQYATDIARMLGSPIFHVNGEDPEAVAVVVRLAAAFQAEFARDVFVNLHCYRRRGHNETDEPRFTQPLLYKQIDSRKSVREAYLDRLLKLGGLTRQEVDRIIDQRRRRMEAEIAMASREDFVRQSQPVSPTWQDYVGGSERRSYETETSVAKDRLVELLDRLSRVPEGFEAHRVVQRFLACRREMAEGDRPVDWSAAEALAFATLASEGHRVRLTGQDSERGTFSQRHAVLHDQRTGERFMPLAHVAPGQAEVEIVNSPLCEAAVLGYEYGYSLDYPSALVAWEAQFGDFINAAQVMVDQFIVSAEDKWRRFSGLVLLLPHGLEGMGPEHSSARVERFLELCADDNIQVIYPTTAAQCFHALRRQALRRWRKPLIMLTPKGLLRNPAAGSTLDELSAGRFRRVIADTQVTPGEVRRLLLCSGKLYYELLDARNMHNAGDVAIIRVEQLYPLTTAELGEALAPYRDGLPAVWVQEEPMNMGAWRFIWAKLGPRLLDRFDLSVVARPELSSPASGSAAGFQILQRQLLAHLFSAHNSAQPQA